MQASDLLHPTTAVFFVASEASAPLERLADAYRRTVVDVKSYVTQLPIYLSAAATLHTGPSVRRPHLPVVRPSYPTENAQAPGCRRLRGG